MLNHLKSLWKQQKSHQILHGDLWKRKICTKFAPHRLMDEQKKHRLTSCQGFIHTRQDNHSFLYCTFLFPKMTTALKGKKALKILRKTWQPNWMMVLQIFMEALMNCEIKNRPGIFKHLQFSFSRTVESCVIDHRCHFKHLLQESKIQSLLIALLSIFSYI